MNTNNILEFYVEMISSILNTYNSNKNEISQRITKRILNWIIREYKGKINLYASAEAELLANGKNLSEYNWKDQIRKSGLGDKGRKQLFLEHILPISQIITNLFEVKSKYDIQNILNEISIAWITREQQKKLDKHHKKDRGVNLEESLALCEQFCGKLTLIGKYKNNLKIKNSK